MENRQTDQALSILTEMEIEKKNPKDKTHTKTKQNKLNQPHMSLP